ncbi:MAG: hypothetical protein KGI38_08950 [Thaumarchaeota archaeon]|nr:hypothetical protein [Nitrososphaerota archaeon]
MRLPHTPGADIIYELSERLYPSPLESFREAIANSLDEGSSKVGIKIAKGEVTLEDWGQGIDDIEKFVKFGEASKAGAKGETIGEKGLGKLSLLRLGKDVTFLTNNGETGMSILMTPEYFDYETKSASRFLNHRGTKVVIPNPSEIPIITDLQKYLSRAFSLRIARGTVIEVNGEKLESRGKIDTNESLVCRLTGAIDVTGNVKEDPKGRGVLDLFVKHVFVEQVVIDPERRFSGWVNCNGLKPTTARNNVLRNRAFDDFMLHIKQHCAKFPRMDEELSRGQILLGNELDRMLKSYLKAMGIVPIGELQIGTGDRGSMTGRPVQRHTSDRSDVVRKLHDQVKSTLPTDRNVKRTSRSSAGILWVDADLGNDNEPIFYQKPNTIYRNLTNDIFKFATLTKPSLGPSWLRIMPYMARAVIQLHPDYEKWDRKKLNLEMDSAVRYFLKYKGAAEAIARAA